MTILSQELTKSVDDLLHWLNNVETMLRSKDRVSLDADDGQMELREAKVSVICHDHAFRLLFRKGVRTFYSAFLLSA